MFLPVHWLLSLVLLIINSVEQKPQKYNNIMFILIIWKLLEFPFSLFWISKVQRNLMKKKVGNKLLFMFGCCFHCFCNHDCDQEHEKYDLFWDQLLTTTVRDYVDDPQCPKIPKGKTTNIWSVLIFFLKLLPSFFLFIFIFY